MAKKMILEDKTSIYLHLKLNSKLAKDVKMPEYSKPRIKIDHSGQPVSVSFLDYYGEVISTGNGLFLCRVPDNYNLLGIGSNRFDAISNWRNSAIEDLSKRVLKGEFHEKSRNYKNETPLLDSIIKWLKGEI